MCSPLADQDGFLCLKYEIPCRHLNITGTFTAESDEKRITACAKDAQSLSLLVRNL